MGDSTLDELNFDERMQLIRLCMEMRDPGFGMGIIGYIELRSLVARLFPDFESVRDLDIDDVILGYAKDAQARYTNPDQLQLD